MVIMRSMNNIRVGILLESYKVPNWLYVAVERIIKLENVDMVAFIQPDQELQHKANLNNPVNIIFSSFLYLEKIALRIKPNALQNKELLYLFKTAPEVISKSNMRRLEELDLDVLLDLSTFPGENTFFTYAAICLSIVSPPRWLSSYTYPQKLDHELR